MDPFAHPPSCCYSVSMSSIYNAGCLKSANSNPPLPQSFLFSNASAERQLPKPLALLARLLLELEPPSLWSRRPRVSSSCDYVGLQEDAHARTKRPSTSAAQS
jgi:hypothetical protein